MCNVTSIIAKLNKLEKRYGDSLPADAKPFNSLKNYYFVSGFEHPEMTVLTHLGFQNMSWGLIPSWASDSKIADSNLNARSETIFEKPSFRLPIMRNRCILPVTGFVEWRHIGKLKIPYLIKLETEDIFSLACIYDRNHNVKSDQSIVTFSILTTEAVGIMTEIHNAKLRMPLILPTDYESAWIDPDIHQEDIISLMQPYIGDLEAYTISTEANSSRNDRNKFDILNPIKYDIPPLTQKPR